VSLALHRKKTKNAPYAMSQWDILGSGLAVNTNSTMLACQNGTNIAALYAGEVFENTIPIPRKPLKKK
jgi:hypothetical protein